MVDRWVACPPGMGEAGSLKWNVNISLPAGVWRGRFSDGAGDRVPNLTLVGALPTGSAEASVGAMSTSIWSLSGPSGSGGACTVVGFSKKLGVVPIIAGEGSPFGGTGFLSA